MRRNVAGWGRTRFALRMNGVELGTRGLRPGGSGDSGVDAGGVRDEKLDERWSRGPGAPPAQEGR